MLFRIMAIEIKRKAPYAHTVCEIVKARYVTLFILASHMGDFSTHRILLLLFHDEYNRNDNVTSWWFCCCKCINRSHIYAAIFLIPLGVIVYTLAGGLKASFLASYVHSAIVHIVLVIFMYLDYTYSSELGMVK